MSPPYMTGSHDRALQYNVNLLDLSSQPGSSNKERDDEADFINFLYQGIVEVVQLNLDIMYEALCVLVIPGGGVNSKFLWLLRPMR